MNEHIKESGRVYIALPDSQTAPLAWVLACHGSGRNALSYRDVPFYAKQRDIALAVGYAFFACDLGKATYGTPEGIAQLEQFYEWAVRTYALDSRCVLWASSAGGSCMFRFAMLHPSNMRLLIGTFPVWDLSSVMELSSMRAAWGNENREDLLNAIAPYNPASHSRMLPNVPIVICQGINDKAVPPEQNSLALKQLFPDRVSLHITEDTHSTEAFSLYDTPLLSEALIMAKN